MDLIIKFFTFTLICSTGVEAYTFHCLIGCRCDTNEEIIHCDDHVLRKTVPLPPHGTHLRGFTVLSLTNNNIDELPDEQLLMTKFPDLKSVDVEDNKNFDCDTLKLFTKLNVLSDCGKKNGKKDDRIHVHGPNSKNEEPKHRGKNEWKDYGLKVLIDDIGKMFNDVGERIKKIT
ncbi:hypothetical protein niasHT_012074 [Heterodera trifolii]|uniref:Uncharacterized protein n=1 Tax=Heterodera trifolii TaxID=157864 RepID=A0ABD2LBP0_9BILA